MVGGVTMTLMLDLGAVLVVDVGVLKVVPAEEANLVELLLGGVVGAALGRSPKDRDLRAIKSTGVAAEEAPTTLVPPLAPRGDRGDAVDANSSL